MDFDDPIPVPFRAISKRSRRDQLFPLPPFLCAAGEEIFKQAGRFAER